MFKVTEYGQLKSNTTTTFDSFADLATCASSDANPCKDSGSATLADSINVTGFTYDGTAYTLDTAIGVDEPLAIQAAIEAEIAKKEINVWVRVTYVGTTFKVEHIGQKALSAIAHSTPGSLSLTRYCTIVSKCDYKNTLVGSIPSITVNGVTQALSGGTYNYTGTSATDATTASTLQSHLATALTATGEDYDSVAVAVNDTLEAFDITIKAPKNSEIYVLTSMFTENNCALDFE